jgi:hypothetical protein
MVHMGSWRSRGVWRSSRAADAGGGAASSQGHPPALARPVTIPIHGARGPSLRSRGGPCQPGRVPIRGTVALARAGNGSHASETSGAVRATPRDSVTVAQSPRRVARRRAIWSSPATRVACVNSRCGARGLPFFPLRGSCPSFAPPSLPSSTIRTTGRASPRCPHAPSRSRTTRRWSPTSACCTRAGATACSSWRRRGPASTGRRPTAAAITSASKSSRRRSSCR